MFERNVVDHNSDAGRKTIAISVVFDDGHASSGLCYVKATRSLGEELNQPGPFIEFAPYNGERSFVAKSTMVRVSRVEIPKADQMSKAAQACGTADPHTILGVKPGSRAEVIRAAYHRLAKQYHPDRFAGLDLPEEMANYAGDMARRVNDAYSMLMVSEKESEIQQARKTAEAAMPKSAYEAFRAQAASRYS